MSQSSEPSVGLVGLGAMGSPIGRRLLDSGARLAAFDQRREAIAPLAERGAIGCASVAEVADRAATVLVSLPTPDAVRAVACGDGGLIGGGAIETFVDLSTTGSIAREIAARLAEVEIRYLDAPVTGGVAGAEAGTLAVLAAGDRAVFDRVLPLLETFGETVLRVGSEPGQGQVAKLLNNLLSATALAVTSEALTLGRRAGLEPDALLEAFNAGTGRNTATALKFPKYILNRRFDSGFRLELMLKDLRLCLAEAQREGVPMFAGGVVEQLWALAAQCADGDGDHTEIVRLFEGWAGVTLEGVSEASHA